MEVLPLLVSLGHGGGRSWLRGNLGQIYAERHDLLPMLRSSQAPGRDYVLLATDESVPAYLNFNSSPSHLVGVRTQELKFGLYAHWQGNTAQIVNDQTLESELYDYSTAAGQAELDNLGNTNDPRIQALKQSLLGNLIPDVLRAHYRARSGWRRPRRGSHTSPTMHFFKISRTTAAVGMAPVALEISRRSCLSARTFEPVPALSEIDTPSGKVLLELSDRSLPDGSTTSPAPTNVAHYHPPLIE